MTNKATFLRLLDTPISEKGDRLLQQIADLNAARPTADVFPVEPNSFGIIPGSPFAYWVSVSMRELFLTHPRFEQDGRVARVGDHPGDQDRYLRLFWETPAEPRSQTRRWVPYQKGGAYSPYYADIHLVIDWDFERETYFDFHGRIGRSSEHPSNYQFFFRPGITWSRRTQKGLNLRPLPAGCAFADKGPVAFVENDSKKILLELLAVMNSFPFKTLVQYQMAFGSYEVGVIQQTPIPKDLQSGGEELYKHALAAYDLARKIFTSDEITHIFCLPALLTTTVPGLTERINGIVQSNKERQSVFTNLQAKIDIQVAEMYHVPELAHEQKIEIVDLSQLIDSEEVVVDEEEDEENSLLAEPNALISNFLMWCVGVAFGRWDVRYALNPETLLALPEPFDPLPICSPGMLKGQDGLPLDEAPKNYPLSIASHGFLVDDPDRPQDDIVAAVRRVLHLLFGANADSIESEACQILEVPDLRAWFRDPKGFFAWHTKRYSKSRRKAPIYWLIQSAKKNYAIWLYYPRLNPDSLFYAAREYADAKLNLETARLEDLQGQLKALSGSSLKAQEKKVAAQTALVAEIKSYLKELDAAAMLQLKPDLNDGVLLNMAPLREIVPWKEPARAWEELLRGKYAWSHIAAQLRQKNLVKGA